MKSGKNFSLWCASDGKCTLPKNFSGRSRPASTVQIFPDKNPKCRKIFGTKQISCGKNSGQCGTARYFVSAPLAPSLPPRGRERERCTLTYLHSRLLPVQVIHHHRNRGTPTRRGRQPPGAFSGHEPVSIPYPSNRFSDVDLKNAHRSLRTADLPPS